MATGFLYSHYPENLGGGSAAGDAPIDLLSDTIKLALLANTHTPNQTTHEWFSDVSANEITGTGYTAGGATLATKTNTTSAKVNTFDCDDPSWSSASFTARYAVAYKSTGTGSTSPLIGLIDFGADQTVASGTFTVQINASGLVQWTVA